MGKKKRGHYCIKCSRNRPNEKFSGKGHRQHICKDCKKATKKSKNQNGMKITEWDEHVESDETFSFIAGYTEGGLPYGTTYEEEWDDNLLYYEDYEYEKQATITLLTEIAEKLPNICIEQSIETSIYTSIALSLYVTNQISLERGAHLANCSFTDFVDFLQNHKIPWCVGAKDGHAEYQKSIDHLLLQIDNCISL